MTDTHDVDSHTCSLHNKADRGCLAGMQITFQCDDDLHVGYFRFRLQPSPRLQAV